MSNQVANVSSSSKSSSSFSSSASSSFSSSSSKTVKSSSTVSKSVSSSVTSSKTGSVAIKSSGKTFSDQLALDMGLDINKEMERLKSKLDEEMSLIHKDMFCLMPGPSRLSIEGGSGCNDSSLVKLDADKLKSCVDKDKVKLNFDVTEYLSESISVKAVGNKIEVHAERKEKKDGEERNEEFSRVYELPTAGGLDPSHVTSSIFEDGVLSIELPAAEAMGNL